MNNTNMDGKEKELQNEAISEQEPVAEEVSEQPGTTEEPTMHPLHGKMKEHYPEREFASDSDVMDAAGEKLDEFALNEQIVVDAIYKDERMAALIQDVSEGLPLDAAIAKNCPETIDVQPGEGSPDYEQIKADNIAKKAEKESFMATLQANIETSKAKFKEFADAQGWDETKATEFAAGIQKNLSDIYNGIVTTEFLSQQLTAETHVAEVEAATENARIEGLNENIDMKKGVTPETDGMPDLASASPSPIEIPINKPSEMEDVVARAKKNNTF